MAAPIPQDSSVAVWRESVREEWIDYNGHLSEAYYVLVFGHATDAVMAAVGLGAEHRTAAGASLYTVEAHVRYLAEVSRGADLEVRSSVIGSTDKLLWVWHEMWAGNRLRATEEILGVHVVDGRSAPFPAAVATRIAAVSKPPGERAGGRIQLGA
jgi:acyl-CoA thioester hydrolase